MRVLYDLRGAQTLHHPERGIARYVSNHVAALAMRPEIASLRGLVDDRPLPAITDRIAAREGLVALRELARARLDGPLIHHIGSLFELELPIEELLPAALRRHDVVRAVTLFDVIPLVYPEAHGGWAGRAWIHRAQLLRSADLVLCISEYTAEDGIARLRLDPRRVAVIGTGVPETDHRGDGPEPAPAVTGLEPGFVLYSGGTEHPRKNLPRLLRAYGALEPELRRRHQLVLAGRMAPAARADLEREAAAAGVAERVLMPGYVSDEVLQALYASCALFVYPSEYEGFGLPIAEAMSHGAPVVSSSASSCASVIANPRATFDPHDVDSMADAVRRGLTDARFAERMRLRGPALAQRYRWPDVAARTVAAYQSALSRARPSRPRARADSLAFATFSTPSMGSPAAALVLLAAAASADVEVRMATPGGLRSGQHGFLGTTVARLEQTLRWVNGELVVLVDTPEAATRAAALLGRHPGTAVLWELDRLLDDGAAEVGGEALADAVAAARRVIVSSPRDAERLRWALRNARVAAHVLAPPLGWVAQEGRLAHRAPLETALMLGARRAAARDARALPLVLVSRPARLGPLRDAEVNQLAEVAIALCRRGVPALVGLLGDASAEAVASAKWLCGRWGARGRMAWSRWPGDTELIAWSTAATVYLDLAQGGASAGEAAIDHALRAGRPIVTRAEGGREHGVRRLGGNAGTAAIVAAVVDELAARAPDRAVPVARTPRATARALLWMVHDDRGAFTRG